MNSYIDREVDRMERIQADCARRLSNSREAGAAFAQVVYEFTQDPSGVGTDRLREAYGEYMSRHAGNFHV